jgi:Na+-driven multidrug efflux pump|tara:strand:- start:102 stop:422 length:321 start_codon:yes stop_codon:yes gene_type:complete
MEEDRASPRREGASFERDWTKGSIVRNLLNLSWSIIINETLWATGFIVDMMWVGKLGVAPIAGVGLAGIVVMVMMTAIFGLSIGTRAMIARFVGADDARGANHVAQ